MEELQEQIEQLKAALAAMQAKMEDLEKRVEANENHEHGPVF
jgi:molecular chaperone GrpE (heat shock protein)